MNKGILGFLLSVVLASFGLAGCGDRSNSGGFTRVTIGGSEGASTSFAQDGSLADGFFGGPHYQAAWAGTPLTGGLMVYFRGISGTELNAGYFLADDTTPGEVTLPNGTYLIRGLGYTLPNMRGAMKCGFGATSGNYNQPISLAGDPITIGLNLSSEYCIASDYVGNRFVELPYPMPTLGPSLEINRCKGSDLGVVANGSGSPCNYGTYGSSLQIDLLAGRFAPVSVEDPVHAVVSSTCLTFNSSPPTRIGINPTVGPLLPLHMAHGFSVPMRIQLHTGFNCSAPVGAYVFDPDSHSVVRSSPIAGAVTGSFPIPTASPAPLVKFFPSPFPSPSPTPARFYLEDF